MVRSSYADLSDDRKESLQRRSQESKAIAAGNRTTKRQRAEPPPPPVAALPPTSAMHGTLVTFGSSSCQCGGLELSETGIARESVIFESRIGLSSLASRPLPRS